MGDQRAWGWPRRTTIDIKLSRSCDLKQIQFTLNLNRNNDWRIIQHPEIRIRCAERLAELQFRLGVDLGNDVVAELREEGPLRGVAAQRPYDQGAAAAKALLLGITGRSPPAWISATGLRVTRDNLREAYEAVWHAPSPP